MKKLKATSPNLIGFNLRVESTQVEDRYNSLKKEYLTVKTYDEGYYTIISCRDRLTKISGIDCIHFYSSDERESNIYLTPQAYKEEVEEGGYDEDRVVEIDGGRLYYGFEERKEIEGHFPTCSVCESLCQEVYKEEIEKLYSDHQGGYTGETSTCTYCAACME